MLASHLDIATLILEMEPKAFDGEPGAVDRASQALAKIIGALLSPLLLQHGDEALAEAVQKIAKAVELQAREAASTVLLLRDDTWDPSDTIN